MSKVQDNKKIDKLLDTIFKELNLIYEIRERKTDKINETYFLLKFIKPMENSDETLDYSVVINGNSSLDIISIAVPNVYTIKKRNKILYEKLNMLNTISLYGSFFYFDYKDDFVINFNHSITMSLDYNYLFKSTKEILDFLDFFMLEVNTILSEDFSLDDNSNDE